MAIGATRISGGDPGIQDLGRRHHRLRCPSPCVSLQGLQLSMLITVNEVNDNEFVVSTLTVNTDDFEETITQAQEEITLDGESAFLDGVDADTIGAMVSS